MTLLTQTIQLNEFTSFHTLTHTLLQPIFQVWFDLSFHCIRLLTVFTYIFNVTITTMLVKMQEKLLAGFQLVFS